MTVFQLCAFRIAIRSWHVAAVCTNLFVNLVLHSAILSGVAEMMPFLSVLTLMLRIAVWLQHDSASSSESRSYLGW